MAPCLAITLLSWPTCAINAQETYEKRKRSLMRKAMELAVMCNSQVALVMFDDKGRLTQFSTAEMDAVLEQYGKAVLEPHERYTPHDVRRAPALALPLRVGCRVREGAPCAAAVRSLCYYVT
jgi:hypothetical protein